MRDEKFLSFDLSFFSSRTSENARTFTRAISKTRDKIPFFYIFHAWFCTVFSRFLFWGVPRKP